MKKIFYLAFFISLCFLFNFEINAEEIDCSNSQYACMKCTYSLPINDTSKVTFIVKSDGQKLTVTKDETSISANSTLKYNYSVSNFELKEQGMLQCPSRLYYSISQTGTSYYERTYTFSFSTTNNLNYESLESQEYNQKKIYKDSEQVKTCNYSDSRYPYNFDVYTDGKKIWYDDSNSVFKIGKTDGLKIQKFIDDNGVIKDTCPNLNIFCTVSNKTCAFTDESEFGNEVSGNDTESAEDIQKQTEFLDGTQFKNLLGALKLPLGFLSAEALDIPLTINGKESATLNNDIVANNNLCSGNICSDNASYLTTQGIRNVRQYCNILYERYPNYKGGEADLENRMKECSSFDSFYKQLVAKGVINDMSEGCSILSNDLKEKLVWILDIIKIAGPILALGLGTLDFIKVLATGDADKEMKTAFKRFLIRLGAAALLFIIPLILAFLLDIFLGNQDGYDSDNPFCVNIDWNE